MSKTSRQTLAWHETLELHELTAAQANGLIKLKSTLRKVKDPELAALYRKAIRDLEGNLRELTQFYPAAPVPPGKRAAANPEMAFYAGDLLAMSKTLVRNYAIAITETATPVLRRTLVNHLERAIKLHGNTFYFMEKNGLYPAYDLSRLLEHDLENANRALSMKY